MQTFFNLTVSHMLIQIGEIVVIIYSSNNRSDSTLLTSGVQISDHLSMLVDHEEASICKPKINRLHERRPIVVSLFLVVYKDVARSWA